MRFATVSGRRRHSIIGNLDAVYSHIIRFTGHTTPVGVITNHLRLPAEKREYIESGLTGIRTHLHSAPSGRKAFNNRMPHVESHKIRGVVSSGREIV